ncbi:hypothetical protein ACM26V_24640 [Salipaludibacillus sp. HK11]|uniref:hypothetical protein n=1 Tax=Salipaludibacillus sp. HK11 TaxID=3394320 RepID=UPI0039FB9CF0
MNVYFVHYKRFKDGREIFHAENSEFVVADSESQAREKTIISKTSDFFNISVEVLSVEFKWKVDDK